MSASAGSVGRRSTRRLLGFSGDAYRNEMGITNELFPDEVALGVDPGQLKLCSPKSGIEDVRDRRTGLRGIDNFENFMKFLAPIERGPIDDSVRAGEEVFKSIGCASCHVPVLTTGSKCESTVRQEASCSLLKLVAS